MKLFLVRHGETDWNANHRYQGHSNTLLNETGISQAKKNAARLSIEKFDAVYSSDLSRAVDTAQEIIKLQEQAIAICKDARWRELSFGLWEGLNYGEIKMQWGKSAEVWFADPINTSPPSGETLLQLSQRIQSALSELRVKHAKETVLVVSHSGAIQALLCLILGVGLNRYWQFHVLQASLTVINFYESDAVLNLFNDVSHLAEK